MKIKSIAALLSATMMMASTVVVNAANPAPTPQEYQTPVSYKYKDPSMTFDGFTVTVPAAINFTSENTKINTDVTVKLMADRSLPTGKGINIKIKSQEGFKLNENASGLTDAELPTYSIKASKADGVDFDVTGTGANYNTPSDNSDPQGDPTNTAERNLLKSTLVDSDFGTNTSQERTKVIKSRADLTKVPTLVGLDNVTFTDILTYKVEVI